MFASLFLFFISSQSAERVCVCVCVHIPSQLLMMRSDHTGRLERPPVAWRVPRVFPGGGRVPTAVVSPRWCL